MKKVRRLIGILNFTGTIKDFTVLTSGNKFSSLQIPWLRTSIEFGTLKSSNAQSFKIHSVFLKTR